MADQKISELVQINIGDLADADEFVIADASASDNKSITWGEMTQSSPTDDTAGRLLTVGSFAYAKEIETSASHVDDLTEQGKYNFSTGGRPDGLPVSTGGTIEVFYDRFNFLRQHFYPRKSPDIYVRTSDDDGATWSDWQEFFHTGNLPVGVFASRADFVAADIPAPVLVASFIDYGMVIYVRRDANGTAITSNSGAVNWAPADKNLLEAYGPERDGSGDDGPILQKAADYDPVVWVYGGEYNFTTPVVAPQMELYGIENPIFYTNVPAGEKVLNIRKGTEGVPRTSRSTLDADASEGDTTITVADGSLYTEGTYIEILSDEYFTGRDDVAGFRSRPKGEFNRIISISGNDLTLEDGLVFAYATQGSVDLVDGSEGTPVVEVNELDLGEPFKMRGIHWIGPGDTGGDPSEDQGYASPVRVTGAKPGSLVENCSFKNHASAATFFYYCAGQTIRNCYISGPDLGDADNNPRADIRWAKGITAGSSMHTVFVGNECRNLRRGVDAIAISTSIMPSWVTNSHNTYQDCKEIVGGHHARHYTAIGNSGRADSLGALRSTDNTIVGNRVQCLAPRACLTIGSARTTSYSEKPPAGHNIIKDNYAIGDAATEGVEIQAYSIDSLDASGNIWGRLDGGDGYLFYVKEIRNVRIKDHFVGTPEADGSSTSTMVRVADTSSVPVSVFNDFYVDATGEGWFDVIVDFTNIDSYENWQVKTGNKITASDLTINAPIGGEAVQSDTMDDTSGRVALVGMGGLLGDTQSISDWDTFDKSQPTNLKYRVTSSTSNNPFDEWMALLSFKRLDDRVGFLGVKTATAPHAQVGYWDGTDTVVEDIWHTGNTTVDGSGFILEASPIVRVYTDSISEPNKPVNATLTHSETGVYVLHGVPPLATEGWQVRTPEDVNGNKVVAIDPPEYDADAGTLTLRTYDLLWHEGRLVPGDPMDVPGDYFVMLRFHEEPEEEKQD